jgi:hypothetical protein
MSPAERLKLFWRMQEIGIARSWALVERSGVAGGRARLGFVVRSRYPEWTAAQVDRLVDAICRREDPNTWLERLRGRAEEISSRLALPRVP